MTTKLNIFHKLNDVERYQSLDKQVKYWIFTTLLILLITVIPAAILISSVDVVEAAEAFLISIGIRSITALSKLIIEHIFKVINQRNMGYEVNGCEFFTVESPLEQYMAEHSFRHNARKKSVRKRQGEMGTHFRVWIILIICRFTVMMAPDLLGAGLISQTIQKKITFSDENMMIPDFGTPKNETSHNLPMRGNCVYSYGGPDVTRVTNRTNSFGYVIFQLCLDIKNESSIDDPTRTLIGKINNRTVHAIFHLEVFTNEKISEDWEPFHNISEAQILMDEISKEENVCTSGECIKDYRQDDDRFIYRVLQRAGEIKRSERILKGDKKAEEYMRDAIGIVVHRLTSATRASFIVLIVTVTVFGLLHSISSPKEAIHVKLRRAIGELLGERGVCFDTAIALPAIDEDVSKHWSRIKNVEAYLLKSGNACETENGIEGFVPEVDHEGLPIIVKQGKHTLIKGRLDCAHYGYVGEPSDVSNTVAE